MASLNITPYILSVMSTFISEKITVGAGGVQGTRATTAFYAIFDRSHDVCHHVTSCKNFAQTG